MPSGIYKRHPHQGFQKGHPQLNTGRTYFKKGIHPKTEFKKGHTLQKGNKHSNWKGGRTVNSAGYILIKRPKHPFCNGQGYVRHSRLVMEKYLGRYLTRKEVVHHRNEIKDDDRIKNFILFKNLGYHWAFHRWGYCNSKGIICDGRKRGVG